MAPEEVVNGTLKNLNWPTVILIVLTGGGNWLTANHNAGTNRQEIEAALDHINENYRQARENNEILKTLKPQIQHAIDQIQDMHRDLDDKMKILRELKEWSQNFKNPEAHK